MEVPETVNIVDENGEVIATVLREDADRENQTTENVLVFIFNSLGKLWIQLRPQDRTHPGKWDISACGGVRNDENHEQAAKRETLEETGLELEPKYVGSFVNTFTLETGKERTHLSYVYIAISDETPKATKDSDGFVDWEVEQLMAIATENPEEYVPSFTNELKKVLEIYDFKGNLA